MNPELKEIKEITQLTMFHKRSVQDILYEWTPRRSPPTAPHPQYLTSYCFSDDYLAVINEGAMKTGSTGSKGNWLGSPTSNRPEGGFLTGDIIQRDGNMGQSRGDTTQRDKLLCESSFRRSLTSSCTIHVVSWVQTGDQPVSQYVNRFKLHVGNLHVMQKILTLKYMHT